MAVLGLRFRARAFSSCGEQGPLFIAVRGPLPLRSTGSRRTGSVVVAHGPSCSVARGILPDRGTNPCPLHWQADSQPLRHPGSPHLIYFNSCKAQLQKLIFLSMDLSPFSLHNQIFLSFLITVSHRRQRTKAKGYT